MLKSPVKPFSGDNNEETVTMVEGEPLQVSQHEDEIVVVEQIDSPEVVPIPPQTPVRRTTPSLHRAVLLRNSHRKMIDQAEEMEVQAVVTGLDEEDDESYEEDEEEEDSEGSQSEESSSDDTIEEDVAKPLDATVLPPVRLFTSVFINAKLLIGYSNECKLFSGSLRRYWKYSPFWPSKYCCSR